jgi:hypothetical protein
MLHEEQVDCDVLHDFSDGVYARTLMIKAGVCLVGARHKTNHFLCVSAGRGYMSVNGSENFYYEAPLLIETRKGTKRAITAIEDTIMTTFHKTDKTDVEEIGEDILEPENIALPQWKKNYLEVQ